MSASRTAFVGIVPLLVVCSAITCSSTATEPTSHSASSTASVASTSATGGTGGAGAGTGGAGGAGTGMGGTGGAGTGIGGTGDASTSGAGTGGAGGIVQPNLYPAFAPGAPQVVNHGGPVLASPKIIPVFFSNDDPALVAEIKDFDSKVGATSYWAANAAEYGVGPAISGAAIDLAEAAPGAINSQNIQLWLAAKLNADDPAWPAPDANTVYSLHYPASTIITRAPGQVSCSYFGGYHERVLLDANHGHQEVPFVVVPRCASFLGLVGIDAVTGAESHELLEASTDPYPVTHPALSSIDDDHAYWVSLLFGDGEIGDLCAQYYEVFTKFAGLPYTVQRTWSNKAALAGHDPCVPAFPNEGPYFNSVPALTDDLTAVIKGKSVTFKGVKIAVGTSRTIDVDLFSDAATGPWTIDAEDLSFFVGGTSHLQVNLDAPSGQNGQKLHLTIKVVSLGAQSMEAFGLLSKFGGNRYFWMGIVGS